MLILSARWNTRRMADRGSIVGFVYNHIGLGGVLLIDCSTYLVSFLALRSSQGRHVVPALRNCADVVAETAFQRFVRDA